MSSQFSDYSTVFEATLAAAVLLPVLSFLISVLVSERYSWVVSILAPLFMLISTICASVVFFKVWDQSAYVASATWFTIGDNRFQAGILLNNLSALMLIVVSLISFLVHLFSIGYMAGDDGEKRYFGMLGLFTFSMLGIVLADNLLLIFVFWELVGFSSYMLIGHWKHKPEAAAAAKKAFLLNRVGDAGFLIGLMILWTTTQTFNLAELQLIPNVWGTAGALLVFCGVIGKSAQFPLLTWLPDAMEGPTPVSALIHAATMVAAGVFLLARVYIIFTPEALAIVAIVGIITALIAAMSALVQKDIKKILAYSTISQLGLMVTAVGAGAPEAAMLHLFTHAFFKACLFLCAGSIIHSLHQSQQQSHVHFDVQDLRNLGGLRRKLPFTFYAVIISGAALSGIPFFSGFLSKEAIFNAMYSWKGDTLNGKWIVFALAFVVSFLTVLYMFRFVAKIFLGDETATANLTITEPPKIMRAPVALLALASGWFIVSWNPLSPSGWIFRHNEHAWGITFFSLAWILLALCTGFFIYKKKYSTKSSLLFNLFYIDQFYHWVFVAPTMAIAGFTTKFDVRIIDRFLHFIAYGQVLLAHLAGWWDSAIIDGVVNGSASFSRMLGSMIRSFQSGKIQLYTFWSVFTIIIFLIWSLL